MQSRVHFRRTVSPLAFACAMCASAPAFAQDDASPEREETLPTEIVVTAQFREQNLQDTPIAITALNAEMLEARGQEGLAEVGTSAPNVTLREAPSSYGPAVVAYIRGVGQRDTTFALEPGVGIYIDDIYFPTLHGSMMQLVDLERLEILRGPQGTLAGQNSIGGAIKLYSKKPRGDGSGFVEATYGSYNRMELRGAFDFALADNLFARVSGAGVRRDGYVTRYDYACTHPGSPIMSDVKDHSLGCKLGTEGGKSYMAGRAALRWEPSDRISIDLIGDVVKDDSEPGAYTLLFVGQSAPPGEVVPGAPDQPQYYLDGVQFSSDFVPYSPYGSQYATDPFTDSPFVSYENFTNHAPNDGSPPFSAPLIAAVDSWGLSANVQVELSDSLNLTSITGYRKYEGQYSFGNGTPFPGGQIAQIWNEQFSQEMRLSGKIGSDVDFTLGGYYFDKESRNAAYIPLADFAFNEDNVVPATNVAAFLNVEFRPVERLALIGGIRYTDVEKTFIFGRSGVEGSKAGLNGTGDPGVDGGTPLLVASIDGKRETFNGSRFDYRAAIQYEVTDEAMVYGQFSTGFKGGGINPRPFFPVQALTFGPETLNAFEVGFKSTWFDRRLRMNGAAFINKYNDILVTASYCPLEGAPPAPCALPLNAGKADIKGFELEVNAEPIDGLMIDASLAYLDFDYTSINPAASSSGIGLEDDGQYIQEWQWSIGAQYDVDLGNSGRLTPRVDINFEDDFQRNANNVDAATGAEDIFGHLPSRLLMNARLTYQPRSMSWQAALEVKNLTDEMYYSDVYDDRGGANVLGTPGLPRTWAMTFKYMF